MRLILLLAFVFSLGIGVAVAQSPPYAPIPAPRFEPIPPSAGPRMLWQPGHWQWNGRDYVWEPGHYVARRPHYAQWVEGHWVWAPNEGRWLWRPPHWQ